MKANYYLKSIIIIIFLFIACNKKNPTEISPLKSNIFIYGLVGVRPAIDNPDSSHFWFYARVFNHSDCQNLQAELSYKNEKIPIIAGYRSYDKYFIDDRGKSKFLPDQDYNFKIWDLNNSYSGTIHTLPPMKMTMDTVVQNQVILKWKNLNADFYDIEFEFKNKDITYKHFQTEENEFKININDLPIQQSSVLSISIAGFKGFNPFSRPSGNLKGCYGFLFGYSRINLILDLQTMKFLKNESDNPPPNLDQFMLELWKNSSNAVKFSHPENINYTFTYAYINNSRSSKSGSNYFRSVTLIEPANANNDIMGHLNGLLLGSYNWGGFLYSLYNFENVYEDYNANRQFNLKLKLNSISDSASVAIPDTFSITSYPQKDQIPSGPFQIKWRRPENADFFFINVSWTLKESHTIQNAFYTTDQIFYKFNNIPDSLSSLEISVSAINGVNPMNELKANLKNLNGYFYAIRQSKNMISYSDTYTNLIILSDSAYSVERSLNEINSFFIENFCQKFPELKIYKTKILKQLFSNQIH